MRDIPVLLLNFNRPELSTGLLDNLRIIQPRKLYIAIDGPRANNEEDQINCRLVENTISRIDWDCDIKTSINAVNFGLRNNVKRNIDWLFSENETGIVLEDDIRFGTGFFEYCQRMLSSYPDDQRIGAISGNNMVGHIPGVTGSYATPFLCNIFHCWGWATWRDRWQLYDDNVENDDAFFQDELPKVLGNPDALAFWTSVRGSLQSGRVNSWAWRMQFSLWRAGRLCLTPPRNLTINVGFSGEATHTVAKPRWLDGWGIGDFNEKDIPAAELSPSANFDKFENHIILGIPMTKSLDLGCGPVPKNMFNADIVYGIDVRDDLEHNIKRADLVIEPIPYEDNYFEFVTAHDFLEHVPRLLYLPQRRNPFVELMNEIYRVLKPNGTFLSFTPAYPHAEAFRDPTHVNIITDQTFTAYFDDVNRWAVPYGFKGAFKITHQEWRGPHLLSILQKVDVPST